MLVVSSFAAYDGDEQFYPAPASGTIALNAQQAVAIHYKGLYTNYTKLSVTVKPSANLQYLGTAFNQTYFTSPTATPKADGSIRLSANPVSYNPRGTNDVTFATMTFKAIGAGAATLTLSNGAGAYSGYSGTITIDTQNASFTVPAPPAPTPTPTPKPTPTPTPTPKPTPTTPAPTIPAPTTPTPTTTTPNPTDSTTSTASNTDDSSSNADDETASLDVTGSGAKPKSAKRSSSANVAAFVGVGFGTLALVAIFGATVLKRHMHQPLARSVTLADALKGTQDSSFMNEAPAPPPEPGASVLPNFDNVEGPSLPSPEESVSPAEASAPPAEAPMPPVPPAPPAPAQPEVPIVPPFAPPASPLDKLPPPPPLPGQEPKPDEPMDMFEVANANPDTFGKTDGTTPPPEAPAPPTPPTPPAPNPPAQPGPTGPAPHAQAFHDPRVSKIEKPRPLS